MNIFGILKEKGFSTIDQSFYSLIDGWNSWYRGNVKDFHNYRVFTGQSHVKCQRFTLGMGKKVAQDWANLLMNEKVEITLEGKKEQDFFDKVCKDNTGAERTKTAVTDTWHDTQTDTETTWGAISQGLGSAWGEIGKTAGSKFHETQETIATEWGNAQTSTDTVWGDISQGLTTSWEGLNFTTKDKFGQIKDKITGTWRDSETETNQKMEAIAIKVGAQAGFALKSVKDNFGKVTSSITTSLKSAQTAVQGLGWYGLGTGIVDGISAGVRAKAAELSQSVANAAYNSMLAAKRALGINSPSRLFRDIIGAGMMEGAAVGVEENQKLVESSIYGMARDVTTDFADTLGMLDGMSGPTFDSVINGIQTLVQNVVSGVHEMIAALEGLRNVGGIFSQTLPTPKMASGTMLPQSREFLSAISVQNSGAEGVSEDTIRRIVREETGGSTELLRAILEAVRAGHVIEVDKRVLGKTVTQEQNRMTRSSGRSALLT